MTKWILFYAIYAVAPNSPMTATEISTGQMIFFDEAKCQAAGAFLRANAGLQLDVEIYVKCHKK